MRKLVFVLEKWKANFDFQKITFYFLFSQHMLFSPTFVRDDTRDVDPHSSGSGRFSQWGSGSSFKNVVKKPYEEFSLVEKDIKDCSKERNNETCANLVNLKKIKLQLLPISLHFFCFYILINFFLLDPDPGGKMNTDPSGSGSTALDDTMRKLKKWMNWECRPEMSVMIKRRTILWLVKTI